MSQVGVLHGVSSRRIAVGARRVRRVINVMAATSAMTSNIARVLTPIPVCVAIPAAEGDVSPETAAATIMLTPSSWATSTSPDRPRRR